MTKESSLFHVRKRHSRPTYVFVVPWDLHYAGGVNQVVANLYDVAASDGVLEPLLLILKWEYWRPEARLINGRNTVYLRMWPPWIESRSILGALKFVMASPLWIIDLLRLCRYHNVKMFNFHYPSISAFPVALLRLLRLYRGAFVLSFHGTDLRSAKKSGAIERLLWHLIFRSATGVVACSRAFAAEVKEFVGGDRDCVSVIHNGLNLEELLRDRDGVNVLPAKLKGREYILSIATFEEKKGLDVLLRSFAQLRRKRRDLALVLIGRAGDAGTRLQSLAKELGIGEDVFFFESVPHANVGCFLAHARVFCLPSRIEPFGIALLEAGAHRLPVVASNVGGIPEIIIDGETGLLVAPDDIEGFVSSLERVLIDPAFASRLGQHLYEYVEVGFSWRRAFKEYRAMMP